MLLSTFALFAQLMAPVATRPVLAFPERGLDDSVAYQGYQTRIYRDAAGNSLQVYLDARGQRVVHLWADAEDESLGFTARADGRAAALAWNGPGALICRRGAARTLEYALVAHDAHISLGWFLLGSMRVERDLQYAERQKATFAEGPFVVQEVERLTRALASLDGAEGQRHLALLHAADAGALRARMRPTMVALMDGRIAVTRIAQPALDGVDTLVMEIRTDPSLVATTLARDSLSLQSRAGGDIPFAVRITTSGRALHPLTRAEVFNSPFRAFLRTVAKPRSADATDTASLRARRLERQVRGLELLSSREKLMAGMPTYATYFGRDMLMTALMMRPVWQPQMSEFVIASALRKLSPDGQVSHEEALGGQAIRESASDYAALVDASRMARDAGHAAQADSLLAQARTALRDLRRVRENYHMIDAAFQFPIVVARWLGDNTVSTARKRAFLLDSADGGEPRVRRLLRELALVTRMTAPYATAPSTTNLISFAPRDSGRWASQSWRDSNVGYAGGRYAMDVNAIWAPHALESVSAILRALRSIGLDPESIARVAGGATSMSVLTTYIREPRALERAVATWSGADRHFLVGLSAAEVQARTRARLAAMSAEERSHWANVLTRTGADRDSLAFLALSLDTDGRPIPVANSDPSTRLFLGDVGSGSSVVTDRTRAEVRRDVRLFDLAYPVGLLVDSVGPVVANDAYAGPAIWRDFERDRYHGPRVVWGRENNLFLLGTMHRIDEASTPLVRRDPANAAYVRELRSAIDKVLAAVQASGFHSELWSYEVHGDRASPIRYGSGSDVQLWSTTDLVVQFERYRLGR
jgi:hypothetical protein